MSRKSETCYLLIMCLSLASPLIYRKISKMEYVIPMHKNEPN